MERSAKVNQRVAAIANRRTTLQLLQQRGQLSRRQLSQITGLRGSTLTYIVRELIEKDIVRQAGKRESKSAGKKQVMLELNPDLGWSLGIGLDKRQAHLVRVDAAGGLLDEKAVELSNGLRDLPGQLRAAVDAWLSDSNAPSDKMLAVGVGLPGVVDPLEGVVRQSLTFRESDVPLAAMLGEAFGQIAVVDNDAACAALAEARLGHARELDAFVHFVVACRHAGQSVHVAGYGSSLFVDRRRYRGHHFGAGEIAPKLQPSEIDLALPATSLATIEDADAELDPPAERLCRHVAEVLSLLCNLLDPPAVVLGGDPAWRNRRALRMIEKALHQQLVDVPGRQISVLTSRFQQNATAVGAALSALEAAILGDEGMLTEPAEAAEGDEHDEHGEGEDHVPTGPAE